MTTPEERTRAIMHTRELLQELTEPSVTPGVPDAVRTAARQLLRHYPDTNNMRLAHAALPNCFGELPPPANGDRVGGAVEK